MIRTACTAPSNPSTLQTTLFTYLNAGAHSNIRDGSVVARLGPVGLLILCFFSCLCVAATLADWPSGCVVVAKGRFWVVGCLVLLVTGLLHGLVAGLVIVA